MQAASVGHRDLRRLDEASAWQLVQWTAATSSFRTSRLIDFATARAERRPTRHREGSSAAR
eukprot:5316771-Pyramimonas_sp.AAC.1